MSRALVMWESATCGGCGHLASETLDPDREGWYQVETVICAACRAIEQEQAKSDKAEPGARIRVSLSPNYKKRS